jgi:hypothetical protein
MAGQGALGNSVSECTVNVTREGVVTEAKPSLTHPNGASGWVPIQPLPAVPEGAKVPGSLNKKVAKRVVDATVALGGALNVSAQSSRFAAPQAGTAGEVGSPTRPVASVKVIVSVRSSITIVFIVADLADRGANTKQRVKRLTSAIAFRNLMYSSRIGLFRPSARFDSESFL